MSQHSSIFAVLPGLEVPVSDITSALSSLWEVPPTDPSGQEAGFRATQMNLILHFGLGTEVGEAREIFTTALRFGRRYPSRIIVLCVEERGRKEALLTSKIFSECYIGKSGRDRSCCEAIILAYPMEGKGFLENQVSILLETDLPTYYWPHRFQAARRLTDYSFFLNISRRVIVDSRREAPEVREVDWPRPEIVRDLACASLLPVRQAVGQFLSGYAPEELVDGLTAATVRHSESTEAEAVCLLDWVKECLRNCAGGTAAEPEATFSLRPGKEADGPVLEIHFDYADGRYFRWVASWETKLGEIEADFGRGRVTMPTRLKVFTQEAALAEAFFF